MSKTQELWFEENGYEGDRPDIYLEGEDEYFYEIWLIEQRKLKLNKI